MNTITHQFLFRPGRWLGKGRIRFSESPEELTFYTRWTIDHPEDGALAALQQIEIEGVADQMENALTIMDVGDESFSIRLDNPVLGLIDGEGVIEHGVIAWQFRGGKETGFEGLEIYDLQENGGYTVHAEYASTNQLRTIIDGNIWQSE